MGIKYPEKFAETLGSRSERVEEGRRDSTQKGEKSLQHNLDEEC